MDKSSGELVTLTPNNNNTVQPVALMRLGVFVPTLKSLKNSKKNTLSRTDATEELTRLSLARAEGFDKVEITGPRLDMDNDFKTWVGIIHSFARHNVTGDKVELPFVEFAKLCGIPSSQSSRRLRERISPSLKRIAGTVISFSRTDEKHTREYDAEHLCSGGELLSVHSAEAIVIVESCLVANVRKIWMTRRTVDESVGLNRFCLLIYV